MLPTRTPIAPVAQAFTLLSLLTVSVLSAESMNHDRLHKRAQEYIGCYSTAGTLQQENVYTWQSQSYCAGECNGAVIGLTNGNTCYCGDQIPSDSDKVDDDKCGTQCSGWPSVNCGGTGFWSFWTSGKGTPTTASGSDDASTNSNTGKGSSATSPPSVVTSQVVGGSTVVITVPATSTSSADSNSSGAGGGGGSSNTAGIAAGVVVGVVALSAIVAGVYFFLRRRKQKQAEEDYKQRTQVADFMRGSNERKPPGSSYSGMSDQRLDPEAGRRNSVGSLADNQDYSRRILRVANPDSS